MRLRDTPFGAAILAIAPLLTLPGPAHAGSPADDPVLARGIREVSAGEDLVATDTLQSAVRRLYRKTEAEAQLAQAYLYLGIAWARLERESRAAANFAEAAALDWELEPPKDLQDEQVMRAWKAAREETRESGRAPPSTAKKMGIGTLGIAGIAAGVVGVAAVVATSGDEPEERYPLDVQLLGRIGEGECAPQTGYVGLIVREPSFSTYAQGVDVLLRASVSSTPSFYAWGGACQQFGSVPECRVRIEGATFVTACFQQ